MSKPAKLLSTQPNQTPQPTIGQRAAGKVVEVLDELAGSFYSSQYLQHGATELANILVHGHAAPMYTSTVSPAPPDIQSEHQASPHSSLVEQHLQDLQPAQSEPALSQASAGASQVAVTDRPSIVDLHFGDVTAFSPPAPEQELER